MNQRLPLKLGGFTLTELVVVIAILAVLGTIGFIATQGYSSRSRDSNRITNLSTVQSGLEQVVVQTGYYPTPDETVSTGSVNGIVFSNKGYVRAGVTKAISMDKIPKDPLSGSDFIYAVTPEKTKYQIATTFESLSSQAAFPFPEANALDPALQRARVSGNYTGYYKFSSGSSQYVINAPSLVFGNSGSVNLVFSVTGALVSSASSINFIVDKGENLPFTVSGNPTVTRNANEVVQAVTGIPTANMQMVDVSGVGKSTLGNVFTGATLANFGGSLSQIETVVLGTMSGSGSAVATVAPSNPSNVAASGVSTSGITWNWSGVAGSTRYETSTNGTAWTNRGNVLSFSETSLSCGTNYTRYVRACNAVGCGSTVTLSAVSTSACPVNCAYTTYNGSCTASCGGGSYNTYYTITQQPSGGGTACPVSEGQYAGTAGSCNTQSCCTPNGSYSYGSCSSNSCGTNCTRNKYDSCGSYVGQDTYYNGDCCTPNGSYSYSSCSAGGCGQSGYQYQYDSCGNYVGSSSCSTPSCTPCSATTLTCVPGSSPGNTAYCEANIPSLNGGETRSGWQGGYQDTVRNYSGLPNPMYNYCGISVSCNGGSLSITGCNW